MAGRRAVATATVVAVLVITLLAIIAAAKLLQAYGSALSSLASAAAAAERPQLSIMSISATPSGLRIVLEDKGGEPAKVLGAYVFEYSASGSPTSAVNCTNITPTYVSVGGLLTCNLTYSGLSALVGVGRPLRLVVVTDRGPVTLGLPPLLGNLIINVQQPHWMAGAPWGAVYRVEIWCPASLALEGAPPMASFSVPATSNATGPTTRTIYVPNLTAVGPCDVRLLYEGPYRAVGSEFALYSPTLAKAEVAAVRIVMDQIAYLTPGGTATVTFKMPEVYTVLSSPPLSPWGLESVDYDFSWYLYPALNSTYIGLIASEYTKGFEGNSTYTTSALDVAQTLLGEGVVDASSPQGCRIESISAFQSFVLGTKTFWSGFALDNGIPFTAGPCTPLLPREPMLTVAVPLEVPSGWRYLVIAVFGAYIANAYDMSASPYGASVSASLSGPGIVEALGPTNFTSSNSRIQAVVMYLVNNGASLAGSAPVNYTLAINLYSNGASPTTSLIGAITLSKIIAIPLPPGAPGAACEYLVNTPNTLPFATVNLTSGTVEGNASVVLNYAISTSYFNSPSQAPEYEYLNTQSGIDGPFYATQGNVQVDGHSILGENATPYYIQNASYAVEIGADVINGGIAIGGLYAYSRPYTPYSLYSGGTPLYPGVPGWYEQEVESSGSWIFLYDNGNYGVAGPAQPAAYMTVTVSGQPGDYIILSLFAADEYGMDKPPYITVSGGDLLTPEPDVKHFLTFYAPVVVEMTSSTTTITIEPPENDFGQGLVGLINVEVVRPPAVPYAQDVEDDLNAPVGIMLVNVTSPTGSVTAELFRADTGQLLATWGFPVSAQGANYLLNAGALGIGGWDAGLQFLDQQVPFLLVIYGAYCRSGTS